MKTIQIPLNCPECGCELKYITGSAVNSREQRAVLQCTRNYRPACGFQFVLEVRLMHVAVSADGDPERHGSDAGYQRHRRNGENPCEACRQAHSDKQATFRTRVPA